MLMPISQHCLHNGRIGITLRPYWSVNYVVGKPVTYTLPLAICLTFHGFIILVLILIAFFDSIDNSSESCFSYTFFNVCVVFTFEHASINKREKKKTVLFDFLISY